MSKVLRLILQLCVIGMVLSGCIVPVPFQAGPGDAPRDGPQTEPDRPGRVGVLPPGFEEMRDPDGGAGRVLTVTLPTADNTGSVMVQALDALEGWFDQRPQLSAAFIDTDTGEAQGTFIASLGKQPVKGFAVACPVENGTAVFILYDYAASLPDSYTRLAALNKPGSSSAAISPMDLQWTEYSFSDGSGSVKLPHTWQLAASNKGMMDAAGPDGAKVNFGIWFPINEPDSFYQSMPGASQLMFAAYAPPREALFAVDAEMRRVQGLPQNQTLQVVEYTTVPAPQGEAAYLHYTIESDGVLTRALAWINTFQTSTSSWVFYFSQITAPDGVFAKHYPVMMEIWKSYAISGSLVQERQDRAGRDLQEMGRIINSVAENKERVQWDAHYNWVEYIRDETLMLDTRYNEVSSQSLHYVDGVVDSLNAGEGYQRYEAMPLRDYYN